jgi:hypothetical protein
MFSYARLLTAGAVALVSMASYALDAGANQAISASITSSGSNCVPPTGEIFGAVASGCGTTAISTGSTAWQDRNDPFNGCTQNSVVGMHWALNQNGFHFLNLGNLCTGPVKSWGTDSTCPFSNGTCNFVFHAQGANN